MLDLGRQIRRRRTFGCTRRDTPTIAVGHYNLMAVTTFLVDHVSEWKGHGASSMGQGLEEKGGLKRLGFWM